MTKKDRGRCDGCDNNFYNGRNPHGIAECWSLKSARLVRRWKLHWWTAPTVPGAYCEVKTYQCHTETGKYAFHEQLPSFAIDPVRLRLEKQPKETRQIGEMSQ